MLWLTHPPVHSFNFLQHQHAFTVKYQAGGDLKLAKHVDDSDITLNVCLGSDFTGGSLYFQGMQESAVMRVPKSVHRYDLVCLCFLSYVFCMDYLYLLHFCFIY